MRHEPCECNLRREKATCDEARLRSKATCDEARLPAGGRAAQNPRGDSVHSNVGAKVPSRAVAVVVAGVEVVAMMEKVGVARITIPSPPALARAVVMLQAIIEVVIVVAVVVEVVLVVAIVVVVVVVVAVVVVAVVGSSSSSNSSKQS